MPLRLVGTLVVLGALVGCDDGAGPDDDAGPRAGADAAVDAGPGGGSDAGPDAGPDVTGDAGPGGGSDAGPSTTTAAVLPTDGAEVLYSAAVRATAPPGAVEVEVTEPVSGASCVAPAPWFECLLDLSAATPGPLTIALVSRDGAGAELGRAMLALTRRAIEVPCTGTGSALDTCILARASTMDAAGFDGVTYLNADNAHARVNTGTMTGIDARVLENPPATVLADVTLGVMNESRAYTSGESCSLVRCYPTGRQRLALNHYEGNFLYMIPEHRDVGIRDYYQWQAPFYLLSQGSSSSERDEVAKALRALAVMRPAARAAAVADSAVGPLLSFLIMRARRDSDVAYLTADALPTAVPNSPSEERILELAAAIRADEIPPVARIDADTASFPPDWSMTRSLSTPFAVGYTPPTLPAAAPAGDFTIEATLAPSADANGRALMFFPVVLREAGSAVTVERLDASGLRWAVRGDFPEDATITTGGQDRIVSRVTVAFFPHNGVWLGAPVMVSVGARPSGESSSNANNLD